MARERICLSSRAIGLRENRVVQWQCVKLPERLPEDCGVASLVNRAGEQNKIALAPFGPGAGQRTRGGDKDGTGISHEGDPWH
jgi:hypothetical protein